MFLFIFKKFITIFLPPRFYYINFRKCNVPIDSRLCMWGKGWSLFDVFYNTYAVNLYILSIFDISNVKFIDRKLFVVEILKIY